MTSLLILIDQMGVADYFGDCTKENLRIDCSNIH